MCTCTKRSMEVRKGRSRAEYVCTSAWSVQDCWASPRQVFRDPESQNQRDTENPCSSAADTPCSQGTTESLQASLTLLVRLRLQVFPHVFNELSLKGGKKKIPPVICMYFWHTGPDTCSWEVFLIQMYLLIAWWRDIHKHCQFCRGNSSY